MSAAERPLVVRAWKFGWNAVRAILRPFAYTYFALEYFVLLLPKLKLLRHAEYVYPLWFWSFGHQAIDLHMLAMRFREKKLLVLLSDYQNFNTYIVDSFRKHVDVRFLRHSWLMRRGRPLLRMEIMKVRALKFAILRFFLRMIGSKAKVLPEYHERNGSILEGIFITERIRLFGENPDLRIVPPAEAIERFRDVLRRAHPELADKWFVSLYLRKKVRGRTDIRDTDTAPYAVVIERVRELGGFVLCGGDYDPHDVFPGMPGVFGYGDFPCDRALADIYFITQCRFIVGPASGPVAVAISYNIPTLMTNDAIFYHSGSRENQIVIYKKLRDRKTGRILPAHQTFSLPIVAFRDTPEFESAGLVHVDNTSEEIAGGLEEMVQRHILGKEIVGPQHQPLYDRFKKLLPPESVAAQTPSKPALSYLQDLLW